MIFLTELFAAFLSAMMVENLIFARAIDIPGLYEKRTPGQIFTIGAVLTVINCISSIPAYLASGIFRSHAAFVPFMALSFLLINGIVFILCYFAMQRLMPERFASIQKSLPFYGVNCVTLGTLLIAARMSNSSHFSSFFGYCLGAGVGFTCAMLVLWSIRQKLALTHTPKTFRGLPITFIYLGIVSLALFGLLGNQLPS